MVYDFVWLGRAQVAFVSAEGELIPFSAIREAYRSPNWQQSNNLENEKRQVIWFFAIFTGSNATLLSLCLGSLHFDFYLDDVKERRARTLRMEEEIIPPDSMVIVHCYLQHVAVEWGGGGYNAFGIMCIWFRESKTEKGYCFCKRQRRAYSCKDWWGDRGEDSTVMLENLIDFRSQGEHQVQVGVIINDD